MERPPPLEGEARREDRIKQLYGQIVTAQGNSLEALTELSGIAMGSSHPLAQELVEKIDDKVSSGELALSAQAPNKDKPSFLYEAAYVVTHPILSLRTKMRQDAVGLDLEAPPHTSTWEEFPELSISQAAKAIKEAEPPRIKGGVPKAAWSESDQELMARGELPKGYPEHPNQ